ncbi:general secretion pathway protein GspK [Candidatus Dependentiae bacterium]|nr:general secretion pathway protein GspK [Candidatus Dependentiae bacterium]
MNQKQDGYILLLTVMIISISVFLVTYISNKSLVYISFSKSVINRQQATVLAWGALQIATSQLQRVGLKEQENESDKSDKQNDKKPLSWEQKFLEAFFPSLHQWQTFKLKEGVEGIDATIRICLSCEEGKINLNNIYDFKEKKFNNGAEKFLQDIFGRIEKKIGIQNLFAAFTTFLKERQYNIQDVTELLNIKELHYFKNRIFYYPTIDDSTIADGKKVNKQEKHLYLSDIFTTWPKKETLQPLLLSSSLQLLLEFKGENNIESRKNMIEQQLEHFKPKLDLKTDWGLLFIPIYGIPWEAVPEGVRNKFNATFEPAIFSVVVATTVGEVTQRLLALLERVPTSQDDRYQFHVKLRKVYWL